MSKRNAQFDISQWEVSQLVSFLAEAEQSGAVLYTKPLSDFPHSDCERDLFAHAALVLAHYTFEALPENSPDGYSNIDLRMMGQAWEVKSPNGSTLRGVETAVRKAQKQFKNQASLDYCPRLIFNARYHSLDDRVLMPELQKRLEQHGFLSALFITKEGQVVPMPLNENPTFLLAGPPGC